MIEYKTNSKRKKAIIFLFIIFIFLWSNKLFSQKILEKYEMTFVDISKILETNGLFEDAVFRTENVNPLTNSLLQFDKSEVDFYFNSAIFCKSNLTNSLKNKIDSNQLKNKALFHVIKDTLLVKSNSLVYTIPPFTYNFSDPFGIDDWTNTFVTKLLATHKGNCRSLSYLYKILADKLGAKCWLALAPNHIYIRNYSQKIGWYNTELTSGTFPSDGWIMTTSYTNPDAVISGLYMDTLSNQQSIAMCVYDLARGYEYQTHNYYDGFILKCCDLVLKYHPVNPNALLLKAETLKKLYLHEKETKYPRITATKSQMEATYIKLAKLGYREMPDKMYKKWLKKLQEEKEYGDKSQPKP